MISAARWLGACAALALAPACAPSSQQVLAENMRIMQREGTPARLLAKGDAAAVGGDMVRAEQYFVSALRAGGDERLLTTRLMLICATDGRYPVAQNYGEDYLVRHPNDTDVRYALATVYVARGELAEARAALEEVVAEHPEMAEPHYTLALVLRDEGDAALAVDAQFREYIRLEPNGKFTEAAQASLLKSVP
jgi:tetratricopeptide (TPR) repeat protein